MQTESHRELLEEVLAYWEGRTDSRSSDIAERIRKRLESDDLESGDFASWPRTIVEVPSVPKWKARVTKIKKKAAALFMSERGVVAFGLLFVRTLAIFCCLVGAYIAVAIVCAIAAAHNGPAAGFFALALMVSLAISLVAHFNEHF